MIMYVNVCVGICVCMLRHVHACEQEATLYVCMYVYVYMPMHTSVYIMRYVCPFVCLMHVFSYVGIYVCMCAYVRMYVRTFIRMQSVSFNTQRNIYFSFKTMRLFMRISTFVRMYVCTHACMYMYGDGLTRPCRGDSTCTECQQVLRTADVCFINIDLVRVL